MVTYDEMGWILRIKKEMTGKSVDAIAMRFKSKRRENVASA
jgi:hypothetical protein